MSLDFIHIFIKGNNNSNNCLLLLHGTGGNENDLVPIAKIIDENAAILSPRGRVLENGMPRYFRRIAPGIFDLKDLEFRTKELYNFILKAKTHYGMENHKIITIGYSNGANMALSLLFSYPGLLSGAILFRPMMPYKPKEELNLNGKKILVLAGLYDELIDSKITKELVSILQSKRANVELNWIKSGHALTYEEVEVAKKWYERNFF